MSALFHYTARGRDGAFVRGSLEAADEAAALASLARRSLFVTAVEPAAGARGMLAALLCAGRPGRGALAACFRSFAVLFRAGVPIRRALEVVRRQCGDRRLQEALAAVESDLEHGLSLSDAMGRRPREFSRMHVTSLRAAEAGGLLDEILERLATMLEREYAARKRLQSALLYPAAVGCAALGMTAFLIVSVLPSFGAMYEQLHVPLPPLTAMLIHAGASVPAVLSAAGTFVALAIAAVLSLRALGADFPAAAHAVVQRLPVAGPLVRKASAARFARMLGMLLRAGVGITASLEVLQDAVNRSERQALRVLSRLLGEGAGLAEGLERAGVHDAMLIQMLRVGEETGAVDAMLLRAAEHYDLDVETALAGLAALLEPFLICVLGGIVAGIAAAVLVPLYSMIGAMK